LSKVDFSKSSTIQVGNFMLRILAAKVVLEKLTVAPAPVSA
jgi:hypothetical protein